MYKKKRSVLVYKYYDHPWSNLSNYGKYYQKNLKVVVGFSPKLKMEDIKKMAVKNNVKTPSVVMSSVAGAVRKFCGDKWESVAIGFLLPRPNHSEFLINHNYSGYLILPTNEHCRLKRLQLCNQRFLKTKSNQLSRYSIVNGFISVI